MRVALVHDWLVGTRGGERVLDALCELLPSADVFTLIHKPGSVPERVERHAIRTSFLQKVPGIFERYRYFLPVMPAAAESFDLSAYDVVVSSSHCVAKGVRTRAPHLAYLHAPMRYMWDRFDDYFGPGRAGLAVRAAARAARPALRAWDRRSARRVTRFVANSRNVAGQIERLYGRSAEVVYPFVDLKRFASPASGGGAGGYFLWVGAFAPNKRVDLAVEAFRRSGRPLWVAGGGQDEDVMREAPRHVRFLGAVPDADLPALYRNARALVFPGNEDFGLTPLEAQAAGRPVIAYAAGGALETVTGLTGTFFQEQTPDSLAAAVDAFDAWEKTFKPEDARAQAAHFTRARFLCGIKAQLASLLPPGAPLAFAPGV